MHEINNKTATIFDVANRAGVSRGTVDRVIYGRGRVSQQTKDKVHRAIEELNYSANERFQTSLKKRVCLRLPDSRIQKGRLLGRNEQGISCRSKRLFFL